jgi:hypothetical protein
LQIGNFNLNGQDADLSELFIFDAESGLFEFIGIGVSSILSALVSQGIYNFSGQNASFISDSENMIDAEAGLFGFSGNDIAKKLGLFADSYLFYVAGPDIHEVGVSLITIARTLIRDNKPF